MVGKKIKTQLRASKAVKRGKKKTKRHTSKAAWGGGRSMVDWLKENDHLSYDFAKRLIGRKKEGTITDQEFEWLQTYA